VVDLKRPLNKPENDASSILDSMEAESCPLEHSSGDQVTVFETFE
jgi:hypothetical protein